MEKCQFRVIAIGNAGVGKTSIINKFLRNKFDETESETIGAFYDSYVETYEDQLIEIQLWDTAGQEQYRSLGPIYYRGASGAILVFDLTKRDSFDALEDWISLFASVSEEDASIVIVGNKSDLPNRAVSLPEIKKWTDDKNLNYIESSAKTGEGIHSIFNQLFLLLVHKHQNQLQKSPSPTVNNSGGECC